MRQIARSDISANEVSLALFSKSIPIEMNSGVFWNYDFLFYLYVFYFISPPPLKNCKINICLAISYTVLVGFIKINQTEYVTNIMFW